MSRPSAVLFDLDGTLVDSAPDLGGAGNDMRLARHLDALPLSAFRPMVGAGAKGVLQIGLGVEPGDAEFAELRDEFFDRYERRLTRETEIFAEVTGLLERLAASGTSWGVVTNKASRFALPLMAAMGLDHQAAVVICGDTTPHSKPHPEPLLEAARRLGLDPLTCAYVGDDLRDIQAGRAAGMQTVVAAWGYLGLGIPVSAWGADHMAESPLQVLKLMNLV